MKEYCILIELNDGSRHECLIYADNYYEVETYINDLEQTDYMCALNFEQGYSANSVLYFRKNRINAIEVRLWNSNIELGKNHPMLNIGLLRKKKLEKTETIPVMLDEGAKIPNRAHKFDGGMDLFNRDERVVIPARGSAKIDTGVHIQIPEYCFGLLLSKSGLNVVHDLTSEGIIDTGYTGSMVVKVYNLGDKEYVFEPYDKVSQLMLVPCLLPTPVVVDHFVETDRGDNGFGSSGR